MACQILGYKRSELQSMTFENLVSNLDESLGASEEIDLLCDKKNDDIDTSEDLKVKGTVLICGKVVEVQTKSEGMVPMSLWLKDLSPDEDRKLAILEPVERTIGKIRVSKDSSFIFDMDTAAEKVFRCKLENVVGK